MKKYIFIFFCMLFFVGTVSRVQAQSKPNIYFFYGTGCPHCALAEEFFLKENLYSRYPIDKREIYFNRENALLFNVLMDRLQVPPEGRGVPMVVMGDIVIMGDAPIIDTFVAEADTFLQKNSTEPKIETQNKPAEHTLNLTLPAVIIGALVDAINPCEFAVLIILMTTILATDNAKKAFRAGLAFSASIFISYFLMGLGLYKALSIGNTTAWFFKIIGLIAIALGLANLKDYFWYGKGFLMEVPMSWRPSLKKLIHSVTNPTGAFFIGFLVSLFLLPCTSGPYIVILGMLAKNTLDAQAILYLTLYNLIFVSPMILISWAVYKGFNPTKAEEIRQKRLRTLHLIAGVVMLTMGAIILMGWI